MLGPLDKSLLGGGDIAIIASSSRSRSDFEKDLEVEIYIDFEIDFRPGPELDNNNINIKYF